MRSNMLRPYALSAAIAFALGTVTSSAASSQVTGKPTATTLDVSPGDRVRVVAAEYGDTPQIGTVAAVRSDGIVFRRDRQDDSLAIPFAHLGQLDVSEGRSAHAGAGLAIGFAAGALGGAVLGQASYSQHDFFSPSRGELTAGGAVLGGLAGAIIGGIIGSTIHTDRWRTVPLNSLVDDAQASVDLIPSSMGPRLAVRVAVRF